MLSQFLLDKRRNHRAVHLFGDVGIGADRLGQIAYFADHLFDALWCLDAVGVFLKRAAWET